MSAINSLVPTHQINEKYHSPHRQLIHKMNSQWSDQNFPEHENQNGTHRGRLLSQKYISPMKTLPYFDTHGLQDLELSNENLVLGIWYLAFLQIPNFEYQVPNCCDERPPSPAPPLSPTVSHTVSATICIIHRLENVLAVLAQWVIDFWPWGFGLQDNFCDFSRSEDQQSTLGWHLLSRWFFFHQEWVRVTFLQK